MRLLIFALVLAISYAQTACNPDYVDSHNFNCEFYSFSSWCRGDGVYGHLWKTSYGTFDQYSVGGEDAWVCPQCGCSMDSGPSGCDNDEGCGCGQPGPSGCDNQCGSTLEDEGCGCGIICPEVPFKKKVVKELLERVEEAVRKTKSLVRKKVRQIQKGFNEPGSNYNDDEIEMIEQIANGIDNNSIVGFRSMMDAIDHLKFHYHDNGESRNRHNDDTIRKRWVKKLFRVIGDKHMLPFKAYLNRKMNDIITVQNNGGLNYANLSNSVEDLAEMTARRDSTALEWLVHAEEQRSELSVMYDQNGNSRSP